MKKFKTAFIAFAMICAFAASCTPEKLQEMDNKTTLTKQKLSDPVTRATVRIFASLLIILSAIMLFADKIFISTSLTPTALQTRKPLFGY